MKSPRFGMLLLAIALTIFPVLIVWGASPDIKNTYKDHARAVELARSGKYDEGLKILQRLAKSFPDDYPLQRDIVLINTWKEDCTQALAGFERIRNHPQFDEYLVRPVADCAVKRARLSDYDSALSALRSLRDRKPDDYAIQRDITIITIWKWGCKEGLREFSKIRNHDGLENYLIEPVSECLFYQNRVSEAVSLIDKGLAQNPGDPKLQYLKTQALIALRFDENLDDDRKEIGISAISDESDQGLREWRLQLNASMRVVQWTRIYARYLLSKSNDSQFDDGDINRVGIGVRFKPKTFFYIDQEFSTDTRDSGKGGSTTRISFKPIDVLELYAEHATYAEDIELRARNADIEAKRTQAAVAYVSRDYIWEGRIVGNRYDYTDTNKRTNIFGTVGYAFEMLPEREQRLFIEWYQSKNTFDNAVYFNPSRDRSVGLTHKTDFIFNTRYKRHVDSLYLSVGAYTQKSFGTNPTWGISYQQDYDFTSAHNLILGAGFFSNYYDDQNEKEWRMEVTYWYRF